MATNSWKIILLLTFTILTGCTSSNGPSLNELSTQPSQPSQADVNQAKFDKATTF